MFHVDNDMQKRVFISKDRGEIDCVIPKLSLVPGMYRVNVMAKIDNEIGDHVIDAKTLEAVAGDYYKTGKVTDVHEGVFYADHYWEEVK